MFLNAGWSGGTLYLAMVLLTLGFGLRHVVRDRGGDGFSAVLVGMALEGVVIDTDHWRHFYLFMAMRRVYGQGRFVTFAKYSTLGIAYLICMTITAVGLLFYTALTL